MQLETRIARSVRRPLFIGVTTKLLVLPVAASLIAAIVLGDHSTPSHVTMFEMAMPPTIGGAIICNRYGLAPPLPSLLVGIGIVASFATLPTWSVVLHRL